MAQAHQGRDGHLEAGEEEEYDVRRLIDYDCHKVDNTPESTDIPEGSYDASLGPKVYVMKYLIDWVGYDSSWWAWEPRHALSEEYDFDEDIDLIQREQPDRESHAEVVQDCQAKNDQLRADFREEWERIQRETAKGKGKKKKKK